MTSALVKYDAMCRAIDSAYAVDEVKDIRDKALAFEAYAKQAKNTEAERRACEIRLRAERKAGQILSKMEMRGGDRRSKSRPTTLKEVGVSRDQSSKWQKLADVPEEDFEAALAGPEKPSTTGLIKSKRKPMDEGALWVWGRLREFEQRNLFERSFGELLSEMTDAMRGDAERLSGPVADWLKGATNE